MIQKTKSVYHVTLEEAKSHLRLDEDFTQDDKYIRNLIQAATNIAENEIQKDIAKTTNVLTRIDFAGDVIRVNEGNLITITSLSRGFGVRGSPGRLLDLYLPRYV